MPNEYLKSEKYHENKGNLREGSIPPNCCHSLYKPANGL